MRRLTPALGALLFCAQGAPQPAGYVGAKACGECHSAEYTRQTESAHARSLYRAPDHPLASRFIPPAPLWRQKYRFAFEGGPDGLRFRTDDGKYVTELPVEWAFGAGIHAVTFLSKVTPDLYLEVAFSYYADSNTLDLTPRHETLPAGSLHEAMGQPVKSRTAGCNASVATLPAAPVSPRPGGCVRPEPMFSAKLVTDRAAPMSKIPPNPGQSKGLRRFRHGRHRTPA